MNNTRTQPIIQRIAGINVLIELLLSTDCYSCFLTSFIRYAAGRLELWKWRTFNKRAS